MAAKKARAPQAEDPEAAAESEPAARGPSVAAHPRAARQVARAKGWAGLIGFALGGYLSLPTNTLAAAGLRALVAGIVCYVVAWAGAVFVWRRLVMLEYAGARARAERPAAAPGAPGHAGAAGHHRREALRIQVECQVVAYVGESRARVQTYTIDLSAGGMLVAGLSMLEKGERFDFELTLAPGTPPVQGSGSVVRTDPQGRCAVVFHSLREGEERRLGAFITEWQRGQRQDVRAA